MRELLKTVEHKLKVIRQLAKPRYARWLFMHFYYPNAVLTTHLCAGVTIQHLPNSYVSRDLYLFREYEPDICDFLSHYLKTGMVIFDIGANIGVYTLLCAKFVGQKGSVHAFEPTPDTFSQLLTNVELNDFSWVKLNQLAVSERSVKAKLYLYNYCSVNSIAKQDWLDKPSGTIPIDAISIDEYVIDNELSRVDLIKIDVEGAEFAVLKGAYQLLSGSYPPSIICEFSDKTAGSFGYRAAELREFLESLGYQLFRWEPEIENLILEPRRVDYRRYANLICIHRSLGENWVEVTEHIGTKHETPTAEL